MLEHLSGRWKSKYFEYICEIKNTISLPFVYSRSDIKESLHSYFISSLNDDIVRSNLPAYKPVTSISRGFFVSEGETSALTVGMKVNNCREMPTQGQDRSKSCPFCPGLMASEYHVAWVCPKVEKIRKMAGITSFKNQLSMNSVSDSDSFYLYVNGLDGSNVKVSKSTLNDRVESLSSVRSAWLKLVL